MLLVLGMIALAFFMSASRGAGVLPSYCFHSSSGTPEDKRLCRAAIKWTLLLLYGYTSRRYASTRIWQPAWERQAGWRPHTPHVVEIRLGHDSRAPVLGSGFGSFRALYPSTGTRWRQRPEGTGSTTTICSSGRKAAYSPCYSCWSSLPSSPGRLGARSVRMGRMVESALASWPLSGHLPARWRQFPAVFPGHQPVHWPFLARADRLPTTARPIAFSLLIRPAIQKWAAWAL